jgi:hypothetical protein
MALRRSLLSPAGLRVPTNRHPADLVLCRSDAISSASPKPTNPLGLNHFVSVRYPRIDYLRTHCVYLACFQQLIAKERPFFRKRVMVRCFVVSNSGGGAPATLAECVRQPRGLK